jgi:glucosamine--fructose-6-phosphate aminotransferase (isomerizing)
MKKQKHTGKRNDIKMCGIVAYTGYRKAKPILLDCLKRLEYRGYDSCGMAVFEEKELKFKKIVGRVENLNKSCKNILDNSTLGIAHTRWATHGKVNERNAHPHFDCKREIAIVHNGIIENYYELKRMLEKEGHRFRSETDTEVIAHLVEKFIDKGIENAFIRVLKLIDGAYAIALIYQKESKKILAARKSSPLILGLKKKEFFIASDSFAMMPYTNRVVFLKDREVAIITPDGYSIKNLEKIRVNKEVTKLEWQLKEAHKDNFKNFMLKEIFEQPKSIRDAFSGRILLKKATAKFGGINLSEEELMNINKIILVGCGTSYHACLYGKYIFQDMLGITTQAEYASEFRYTKQAIDEQSLVIFLSQSGETADVIAALDKAKKGKAKTLGLINVVGSTIARDVDGGIYLHAGQEVAVASTKTFTSHLVVLYLLAVYLARIKKKLSKGEARKLLLELKRIPLEVEKILKDSDKIRDIALKYYKLNNALYLARTYNYPIALEGALKLKEISYIHAEANTAAEMKHGPIALIDKDMFSVFIAPYDELYKKILSNIEEIKSRNGKIIAITTEDNKKIMNKVDDVISISKVEKKLIPIVASIPVQLFAYHMAMLRGCDVDKPRNLAKSVTVE